MSYLRRKGRGEGKKDGKKERKRRKETDISPPLCSHDLRNSHRSHLTKVPSPPNIGTLRTKHLMCKPSKNIQGPNCFNFNMPYFSRRPNSHHLHQKKKSATHVSTRNDAIKKMWQCLRGVAMWKSVAKWHQSHKCLCNETQLCVCTGVTHWVELREILTFHLRACLLSISVIGLILWLIRKRNLSLKHTKQFPWVYSNKENVTYDPIGRIWRCK